MFCDQCGTSVEPGLVFCPSCGKNLGGAPRVSRRMSGHFRALGILWLVVSAFRLLPGIFLWFAFRQGTPFLPPEVPFFVHGILRAVSVFLLAGGVIGIVAGWGLLERQPWARMLTIILGCLNLFDIPVGTALGIYSLWVLLPAASEQEYRQSA